MKCDVLLRQSCAVLLLPFVDKVSRFVPLPIIICIFLSTSDSSKDSKDSKASKDSTLREDSVAKYDALMLSM